MALRPATNYPGQTMPPDADHPLGSAQNITVPNDGTGTPWIKPIIDDIWGHQQALLQRAGIQASGAPDTARESQYVQASQLNFGTTLRSTSDILTTSLGAAGIIRTEGFAAQNDGGGATWVATGITNVVSAGTLVTAKGLVYDADGLQFQFVGRTVDPRQFGAVGDGVTDCSQVFDDIVRYLNTIGGGIIDVPALVFSCSRGQLLLRDRVILRGNPSGGSVLDYTGASLVDFPNGYCVFGTGATTPLPEVSSPTSVGTDLMVFDDPHGVEPGDIIYLTNTVAFSLSSILPHYKGGDIIQVRSVPNDTTIETVRAFRDGYPPGVTEAYKLIPLRTVIENLEIRGPGASSDLGVLGLRQATHSVVRRVRISGTQAVALLIDRCYNTLLEDPHVEDYGVPTGDNRLIFVSNSQSTRVIGGRGGGTGSFLVAGGQDVDRAVPTRDLHIEGCHLDESVTGGVSIQIQGNVDYYTIKDCTLRGLSLGGNHGLITGGTLFGSVASGAAASTRGAALVANEMNGYDHLFRGVSFVGIGVVGNDRALVQVTDPVSALSQGGALRFTSCDFTMPNSGTCVDAKTYSTQFFPSLHFSHCVFNGPLLGSHVGVDIGAPGAGWDHVVVSAGSWERMGLDIAGARLIDIDSIVSKSAVGMAVRCRSGAQSNFTEPMVFLRGNHIIEAGAAGIFVDASDATVVCANNVSLRNNQVGGANTTHTSATFLGCKYVMMKNNELGDDMDTPTQPYAWYAGGVGRLVNVGNFRHGGLVGFEVNPGRHEWWGDRDGSDDEDVVYSSGRLGLSRGDPTADYVPNTSDDVVVGNGAADVGMYFRSRSNGNTRIMFGDPDDDERGWVEMSHDDRKIKFAVDQSGMMELTALSAIPGVNGLNRLGENNRRWGQAWADEVHIERPYADGGTPLANSNVLPQAGWGGTPASSRVVGGTDAAGFVRITAGGGPSASPEVVVVYADGAWSGSEPPVVMLTGTHSNASAWTLISSTATQFTAQLTGVTPVSGQVYGFHFSVIGLV